jgi:hypothetical protein
MSIKYIGQEAAGKLVESTADRHKEKNFIINGTGFANHLRDTGNIGYATAAVILEKHPELAGEVDADHQRVAGCFHDYTKIIEGSALHEIGTAYFILTEGEKHGLVSGGTYKERQTALRSIASLIPPDYALFEELGGSNYPTGSPHSPEKLAQFEKRLSWLRQELSTTDQPLSIEEFALPLTLAQQIALYADLTNVRGEVVSMAARLDDIVERYQPGTRFHEQNPIFADVTEQLKPRALKIEETIKGLMA